MMLAKITSAFAIAAVVFAGVVLVNGQHNNDAAASINNQQQRSAVGGGIRRLSEEESSASTHTNRNSNDINREWLNKYVANPQTNPNHHKAMVEMLIRYGTSHVGKSLSMDDVKDALAIEFLSQVDGRPIPVAHFDYSLFIGTIGSAYNLEGLKQAGITHIVSAARSARMNYSEQIQYKRIKISDHDIKETPEELLDLFLSTCNYIDTAIKEGGKVLVHDWEGAGRSGAFIVAYVMKSRKMTYANALQLVKKNRSIVNPEKSFVKNLELWEKMLGLDKEIGIGDDNRDVDVDVDSTVLAKNAFLERPN